jgi:DNA polymerase III delta prime subunit
VLNAEQIEQRFQEYLFSKVRRGALLITGDWGTGKTQLALARLKPIAEKLGFKVAYLSAADVDSLEGFERNLLIASYHWLGSSKAKPYVGIGVEALRHWGSKLGISVDSLAAARNTFSDRSLILVDDLERASLEVRKRILYRLANLFEVAGTKSLVLADESQLAGDAGYGAIKEKAIARTLEYQPTHREVARIAIEVVYAAAPKTKDATQTWGIADKVDDKQMTDVVASVLEQGNCRNLRSAIAAITEACELFDELLTLEPSLDDTAARSLVHSCVAYLIEIKKQKEYAVDLRKYVDATTDMQWSNFLVDKDQPRNYLIDFDTKYSQGIGCEILKSAPLLDYLEKGSCSFTQLISDIRVSRPKDESVAAFKRLNRYEKLSSDEFQHLTKEAIDEIDFLKIRSFHSLAESAHTLFFLAGKSLLPISPVDLRIHYIECLSKLAAEYASGSTDVHLDFDPTLIYGNPYGELKVVIDNIQNTTTQLERKRFERAKRMEIDKLATDPDGFVAVLNSVDSTIARSACLENIDAERIFQILNEAIKTGSQPHTVVYKAGRAIASRYLTHGVGPNFRSEIHFLDRLHELAALLRAPNNGSPLLVDAIASLKDAISKSQALFNTST